MEPIGCLERPVNNYQPTLRIIPATAKILRGKGQAVGPSFPSLVVTRNGVRAPPPLKKRKALRQKQLKTIPNVGGE